MTPKSRILFPALAAVAILAIALVLTRKPIDTSAQTTGKLPEAPQPAAPARVMPNGPHVVMDTSMGRITCQFFQKEAPVAVANFIGLATGTKDWTNPVTQQVEHDRPLYDGTVFHRVIPGFMVQGGDPTGTGYGSPGYKFDDEVDPNLNFDVAGRLAMANNGPNTNGSQFFITEAPYPALDQHYTIFGQCDDPSVDVVKTIARVPRDESDRPITPVVLRKVTVVPEGKPLPPLPAWEQPDPETPAAPAPQP
jgi:peptidyl-prolyl cis-trans isomerase A (cyclophilin A)